MQCCGSESPEPPKINDALYWRTATGKVRIGREIHGYRYAGYYRPRVYATAARAFTGIGLIGAADGDIDGPRPHKEVAVGAVSRRGRRTAAATRNP